MWAVNNGKVSFFLITNVIKENVLVESSPYQVFQIRWKISHDESGSTFQSTLHSNIDNGYQAYQVTNF